ncbi:flagellar basal body rod protein FlgC [bacterium]|nr:flagellar basal body rod protein FlgC [bacterium]
MNLASVMDIAGTGMAAQTIRLNTTASNLANAETVAGSEEAAYRAIHPVFSAMNASSSQLSNGQEARAFGVMVEQIINSEKPVSMRYEPGNPVANEEGYVYYSNVNVVEEMANMISASRSFQMNVEMMNTGKSMAQRLLTLGQ